MNDSSAVGRGPAGRPVYLHFANREIYRSVDKTFSPPVVARDVALTAMLTEQPLVCSLGVFWESRVLEASYGSVAKILLERHELDLVSEYATLDGFLRSAEQMYTRDRQRYGVYFEKYPQGVELMTPSLVKSESTTKDIRHRLEDLIELRLSWASTLTASDLRSGLAARSLIEAVLNDSSGIALTYSAFENAAVGSTPPLAVARILSLVHLQHYLSFSGADIVTGIPGLTYFDRLRRSYPTNDMWYFRWVLSLLVPGQSAWHAILTDSVQQRGTASHLDFLAGLRSCVAALDWRVREEAERLQSQPQLLRRSYLGQLAARMPPPKGLQLRANVFSILAARLSVLRYNLNLLDDRLRAHQEEYMAQSRASRMLLLVATELERDAVFAAVRTIVPDLDISKSFLPYHTVYHLGLLGGSELSLVESEQGSELPGSMASTAADVAQHMRPDYMVLLGIGFGLKEDSQSIGDLMISTQLRLWGPKKSTESASGERVDILRGDKVSASVTLIDRCRSASVGWTGGARHFGLVLSAHTLVNSIAVREQLRTWEPDAIGGEMEAAGMYIVGAKRKIDWLVIKGISDWGHGKTDDQQELAAGSAAAFAVHVISQGGLSRPPGR